MNRLNSLEELDAILRESGEKTVLLLKHSTRCPFSGAAYEQIERFERSAGKDAPAIGVIHIIEDREISRAVTARLGVKHESPQAIAVSGGSAIWSLSHGAITEAALRTALAASASGCV